MLLLLLSPFHLRQCCCRCCHRRHVATARMNFNIIVETKKLDCFEIKEKKIILKRSNFLERLKMIMESTPKDTSSTRSRRSGASTWVTPTATSSTSRTSSTSGSSTMRSAHQISKSGKQSETYFVYNKDSYSELT